MEFSLNFLKFIIECYLWQFYYFSTRGFSIFKPILLLVAAVHSRILYIRSGAWYKSKPKLNFSQTRTICKPRDCLQPYLLGIQLKNIISKSILMYACMQCLWAYSHTSLIRLGVLSQVGHGSKKKIYRLV